MGIPEYQVTNHLDLKQLLDKGVFWRPSIGMIVLKDEFLNNPQKSFLQNELNTHYYACGCDESAGGFFLGVILGCLWIALSWFDGVTPSLVTILIGFALAAAGGLIGKAYGKLIANRKLIETVQAIQKG
jgi:hypothetical protein